jgi:hypothetical protein
MAFIVSARFTPVIYGLDSPVAIDPETLGYIER